MKTISISDLGSEFFKVKDTAPVDGLFGCFRGKDTVVRVLHHGGLVESAKQLSKEPEIFSFQVLTVKENYSKEVPTKYQVAPFIALLLDGSPVDLEPATLEEWDAYLKKHNL